MKLPENIKKGLTHPAVVAMAAKFSVKVGQESYLLYAKQIDFKEWSRRVFSHFGEVSGTTIGATVGSVLGGYIPGVGPALGGFAGAMVGQLGKESALGVHERLKRAPEDPEDPTPDLGLPKREL